MDLTLTAEQQMLADAARALVDRESPPARVRQIAVNPVGLDRDLWGAMAALGWPGLLIDEADGGAGGRLMDLALVCEALGRGPVPSPLVASGILAALPIARAGTDEQRARWLPALAAGEAIGTLAVIEPGGRDEWDWPGMAGGSTLRGTKLLVPWAGAADVVVVTTAAGLHLVEPRRGAISVTRHDDLGGDPLFVLELDDAPAELLGAGASNLDTILSDVLDQAAVAQLAFAVGAAERALELSVQHAQDRHQFGRPIGAFQAVAHRCVDMRTDLDACRYLGRRAAWAVDVDPAGLEISAAKAYSNDAMRRIFANAHQVHGAIGFSTEHDLHLYTRYAKSFELSYGTTARHLERVATSMGL